MRNHSFLFASKVNNILLYFIIILSIIIFKFKGKKRMKEFIDPFLYNLPHIDLHGYDRTGAVAVTKMFIDECIKMKEKKLVIVHGKGTGILKKNYS
jgi:dsDNA-specific endonuclease/ATPase MutS2